MITVTVWRKTLVAHGACETGLALFDRIAATQPPEDKRRLRRIRVARWTALHTLWLTTAAPSFYGWLERNGIIPRANLSGANLSCANLRDANLSGANLSDANLSCANLRGANLSYANLSCANLRGANLSGANLRSADLSYANLSCANLSGANLRSADLSGANLSGADLSGAYRGSSPPVPGWRCNGSGYLERDTR